MNGVLRRFSARLGSPPPPSWGGLALCFVWLLLTQGCASTPTRVPVSAALADGLAEAPVVLVPGITGSWLQRDDGEVIWGLGKLVVTPKDRGYSLARSISQPVDGADARVEARFVLDEVSVGPVKRMIYRPLPDYLERHGYRRGKLDAPQPGDTYFDYAYDWRSDNVYAARQLHQRLEALARVRSEEESGDGPLPIDLICQSNGAHICRYLAKYGAATLADAEAGRVVKSDAYRIRKVILIGTSNGGAMRGLREIHRGRKYIPFIGRVMQPEVLFTLPALFQDLPAYLDRPFVDLDGASLDLDPFDVDTWVDQGWSIFRADAAARADLRPDLFGDVDARKAYLKDILDRARRLHAVLARDAPSFDGTRIYSIQNAYKETPYRAVVDSQAADPGRRLLFTGDPELKDRPYLASLVSAPGDGHAEFFSQNMFSPQEQAALGAPPYITHGEHFGLILEPATLRRLLDFLGAP